jgi:hypothetical protein
MKMRDFLENWGLTGLKLNLGVLGAEFSPADPDRAAAWDLYVELLTRITTQYLEPDSGDEKAALDSVYALFPLTREILKTHGSGAGLFAKIAIPVLNQIIRPFTARWHRLSLAKAFESREQCAQFRSELADLQVKLRHYTQALAKMANVEDLTSLEDTRSA